ncbi:DUF2087 domain-containing protein [Streptomyces diastatochromogenes]|uniref:DUF2087 domain-containing protein n=1 Tax=Streptomyces diastatochromogenes TaxID=42236 RepID=UPI0036B4B834
MAAAFAMRDITSPFVARRACGGRTSHRTSRSTAWRGAGHGDLRRITLSTRAAAQAGVNANDTALALLRLREQGVVTADGAQGGLAVSYGLFRGPARRERPAARSGAGPDAVLGTFVRDGRLVRLPAQWTRKKLVLRHIAEQTFEPGAEYPERVVNERLRAWCEDSDEIDHVTLRRYLVDLHHLHRSEGIYRRPDVG